MRQMLTRQRLSGGDQKARLIDRMKFAVEQSKRRAKRRKRNA